jgi:hypothetical protein
MLITPFDNADGTSKSGLQKTKGIHKMKVEKRTGQTELTEKGI